MAANLGPHFTTMDGHFVRGVDAQSPPVAPDLNDGDDNGVGDDDAFQGFAREYEHVLRGDTKKPAGPV